MCRLVSHVQHILESEKVGGNQNFTLVSSVCPFAITFGRQGDAAGQAYPLELHIMTTSQLQTRYNLFTFPPPTQYTHLRRQSQTNSPQRHHAQG